MEKVKMTENGTTPHPVACSYCSHLLVVEDPESYRTFNGKYWCGCDEGLTENTPPEFKGE
jgi:hypothetical protein